MPNRSIAWLDTEPNKSFVANIVYTAGKLMGLNLILLTIVAVSCAITILQTRQDAISNSPRWVKIAVGLLVLMALLLLAVPTQAGYWITVVWTLLVIIPSLGFRLSDYFFYRGNYVAARQLKAGLRWLHPLHDWRWQAALFTAYDHVNAGDAPRALQLLQNALDQQAPPPEQEVMLFYLSRDWYVGISYAEPAQIIAQSDFLCCLLPFTPATELLLNAATFAQMKPGAYLVNCGSGSVIDETALAAALERGQLGGAALDTFEWEPIRPDNPLLTLARKSTANVLLTPHTAAGAPVNAGEGSRSSDYTNIERLLANEKLFYRVA